MSAVSPQMAAEPGSRPTSLDVDALRREFPALAQEVYGRPLVYLDNGATTQKPQGVIDAVDRYYGHDCANVHRGAYALSERATDSFEGAREKVRRFIHAARSEEVVFVRGATEAINLVAAGFARKQLKPGDEILVSEMEHHSNIVPWQLACERTGATLKVWPFDDQGRLSLDELDELLVPGRSRLLAVTHVSNVLGTVNPIREIVGIAHGRGVPVLVDGAQAVPHLPVDVVALGCDFYAFSSHKMYGPTGIGVLYGRFDALDALPPYQGGGDMIRAVTFEKTTFAPLPHRLEAGTPSIASAIGLGAAIDFMDRVGRPVIAAHEQELLTAAARELGDIPSLRVIGTAPDKTAVVTFTLEGIHPHDIATVLDRRGIAIRAGHHCAQPVMKHFHVPATARASFALYNTTDEIRLLAAALREVVEVFSR